MQIKDIVQNELCVGCGACVRHSKAAKMEWNEDGFLVPQLNTTFDEMAIKVCPFNIQPDDEVADEDKLANLFFQKSQHIDEKIGRFENTYVGYANEYRETSSSGGIATYVFEFLLSRNIVNHLFIVKEIEGTYQYQWFDTVAQIREISKTRYIPVTLEKLFEEIDSKEGKVAVSGVACFVKALRLKQHYYPEYKEKIPFIVGIICGGLKSRFFTDYLAQKSGIRGRYSHQQYRIKDAQSTASDYSFGALDEQQQFHQIKMQTVGDMWGSGLFKSNACDFCTDVTTELADISLGDAWLHPYSKDGLGTSVIVTRSKLAEAIIQEGMEKRDLTFSRLEIDTFKASQAGSFKHRHSGLKYRINNKRKQGKIVPNYRIRFSQNIPIEFRIVQSQRMKVRELSLILWKQTNNSEVFEQRINLLRSKLDKYTLLYHRIQKIKRIFKWRTI